MRIITRRPLRRRPQPHRRGFSRGFSRGFGTSRRGASGPIARRPVSPLGFGLADREPDPCQRSLERHHRVGVSLAHRERPDLRPSQRDAVATERIGNRAHVCPGTDEHVECHDAVCIRDDVERVDPRPSNRHLDGDTTPVQSVGTLTSDLDGRRRRDRQVDLTTEARERSLEARRGRRLARIPELSSLRVAGGRAP